MGGVGKLTRLQGVQRGGEGITGGQQVTKGCVGGAPLPRVRDLEGRLPEQ